MILLHHLRVGRSLFTVWLLEELGVEYELKIYLRDAKTGRAQADLKQAHPLGKSPVIEDNGLVLAESGAITQYLINKFDTDQQFAPAISQDHEYATYSQWLHYSEGSAFAPLLMKLLLAREREPHPPLISAFANAEIPRQLDFVEEFLADKPYLLGKTLQGPDFGMGFILQLSRRLGVMDDYPALNAYLDRLLQRPAYQRAVTEKTICVISMNHR